MVNSSKNICVVVLGDIGRSPRMQYHSQSLAEHGHKVDIIGYGETEPIPALKAQPLVSYHYLAPYPSLPIPKLLNYICKTVWQALTLFFVLFIIRKADVVLVQNPPAVPTLLVCWFYSCIFSAKLIIDWHNYAHTIMALSVGRNNILVKLTRWVEAFAATRAARNFCVTNAMREDLERMWNVKASTLYDRPPEMFQPISLKDKHEVLSRLGAKYKEFLTIEGDDTAFTQLEGDAVKLRSGAPGLIISSTSWTEDEDFSVLLTALNVYENHIAMDNIKNLPKLVCVITGKGPLKEYYCSKISKLKWSHVAVVTPWLESEDYPKLLACADLGICLHTSSSGFDLPMKVVDMFGCELPVCAYDFNCLDELVKNCQNSYTFKDSRELSQRLEEWFENFPNSKTQNCIRHNFKTELKAFQTVRWRENWNNIVLPIISE